MPLRKQDLYAWCILHEEFQQANDPGSVRPGERWTLRRPEILTLQMLFLQRLFFEVPLRAAFAKSQARVSSMRPG